MVFIVNEPTYPCPIGLVVVSEVTGLSPTQIRLGGASVGGDLNIGRALMLGIAYSASVGGITTIIGTPPNAVAYATGCFSIKDMAKAGICVNMFSFLLIPLVVYFLIPLFWGENLAVTPEWALGGMTTK